ncbi:MAG: N-acetyl-gamma-glutamyl-phosphate reductase [Acidobacteria bacterium]|nr:MAG: N-acetyl-gamma-glutamyl-phosphate reductase [Acidobacteriota bacterium]
MSDRIRVSIVGASGYVGGELLRLLLAHPSVDIATATSERHAGTPVSVLHPNLRRISDLSFSAKACLEPCDALFLCLPHGQAVEDIDRYLALAPKVIDLSADFRLRDPEQYPAWYGRRHARPDLVARFVYGIPELHRQEMTSAAWISSAGCNATAVILALYPLYQQGLVDLSRTVVEAKVGSSEGGAAASDGSHHPERSGCVRSYKPTGHRHLAEMAQELPGAADAPPHFSATAIEMVRGILATCHVFLKENLPEKAIWQIYRRAYGHEPFVRIVKARDGVHRYPEPKLLSGTNFCDIGFERDDTSARLVVMAAIDNLMKGSAGQAVQAFNIMHGLPETTGLGFAGLHPI